MNASQYIYTLRVTRLEMLSTGPSAEESEVLQQHVSYLEHLTVTGNVLLSGRTQTTDASTFGIVIINATTEERATEIMANDPAIRGGVMSGELFPYRIALVSPDILGDLPGDA